MSSSGPVRPSNPTQVWTHKPGPSDNNAPHEIWTISRGQMVGNSSKVRKKYARQARSISTGLQINMADHATKFSMIDSMPVAFTEEDARRIVHSHNDPLVLVLRISNGQLFRVLIDTSRSTKILLSKRAVKWTFWEQNWNLCKHHSTVSPGSASRLKAWFNC